MPYPADGKVRRLTPRECEGLQGFPEDWTIPHDVSGEAEDIDTPRYRALGNAVTVNVAQWLGERVLPVVRRLAVREEFDDHRFHVVDTREAVAG